MSATNPPQHNEKPLPGVVRHDGPCGPRRPCWRPECRQFDPYRTIELLHDKAVAHCHGSTYALDDPLLRIEVAA